ncbi:hypothetical protein Tco_0537996, partial [Tanacetum coccineum]
PNLAERARISAINLDDYQLDPVTPPPSPSSPFSMAAYQRMIAETDPTRREEALTAYGTETGQGSVPVPETVLTYAKPYEDRWIHSRGHGPGTQILFGGVRSLQILWDDRLLSNASGGSTTEEGKEALEEVVQRIYRNNN